MVAEHSEGTALTADGTSVSYRRLDAWSLAISSLLRSHGVGRGDRVALRMPASAEAIASMVGVLRTGASYVPLEVRNPPARNRFIVQDSQAVAFIGDPDGCAVDGIPVIGQESVTELKGTPLPPAGPADAPSWLPGPDDTAYVIYTSGTTGQPKGVPIHHGAVIALLAGAAEKFSFSAADRWLLFHSIAFDFSVWEIWGPLSTGARLVIMPPWTARSPERCLRFLAEHDITVLNQTPTAFSELSAAVLREDAVLPRLRYVIFDGEKLLPGTVRPWAKRFGLNRPTLVNMYGITETTVHTTFHEVTQEDLDGDASVIGRPLPGFGFRVVASDGRDAKAGEQGELWLSGPQLSKGYLNRPELNAERFVSGPAPAPSPDGGPVVRYYRSGDLVSLRPGGDLVFHGRADLQVKLRGHRIELSDIEAAVQSHSRVADAVVWVREFAPGDERLVCAYVPADDKDPVGTRDLRAHVKDLLPTYMRPTGYQPLPRLPRTVNGKVDRAEVVRLWEKERERAR
ncbi:amino acid adenylation domain-containing protein [Streptomyces flaveus]|uniref:amino acid adenylation domain-containing protein n=1 Tax=Streptomyces flaveus TaxID=66370 RepID=UPI001BCA5B68|nr:amino acid adenylation domain-containing protein [Streptomyces flaveus]